MNKQAHAETVKKKLRAADKRYGEIRRRLEPFLPEEDSVLIVPRSGGHWRKTSVEALHRFEEDLPDK